MPKRAGQRSLRVLLTGAVAGALPSGAALTAFVHGCRRFGAAAIVPQQPTSEVVKLQFWAPDGTAGFQRAPVSWRST
ncbi:hypothetical protein KBY93_05850 [Synechococcus sp. J7-Johnson]|uniref:hypothetical protein n=1 Tax=Synechococcus sp. J7-Johnson TaxID=2823737 RepID=UPI0020CEE475|nr:hypothetical protein [Synechococcus sp. J7-Johnson]MCP9840159.1 hypothetical protein [Synechococcus sp. J7-Johnson]